MGIYMMFGKYNPGSMAEISPQRSDEAQALIQSNGGTVQAAYAMLGDNDLLLVVDFPDLSAAIKTSVNLSKHLGVSFSTTPAVTIEEFDKLV